MRRREDAELLKLMPGLRMVDLNLKDAPLRLRCTAEDFYTLAPGPEDTAIAKIHKALAKLEAEKSVDAILLPLGLGHHVDHLVVRNAALAFAATRAFAFYEDLPDAFRSSIDIEEAAHAELNALRESGLYAEATTPVVLCHSKETTASAKIKRRIVSVYASQIDGPTMEAISAQTGNYAGGERIWTNPAWIATFLS